MNALRLQSENSNRNNFEIEKLGDTSVPQGNGSAAISQGVCIVHTNPTASSRDDSLGGLTAAEYRTFQEAYNYFNLALFDGSLPQVLITLQRHHGALGYFSAWRFQSRRHERQVHEVALNPDGFTGNTDEEILSTLAHEMVHVWQLENGRPGRGRYHNREWALKMLSIGLMPSATGNPGGAVTGDCMSHYILEGGEFDVACKAFLNKYRLAWESAAAMTANEISGDDSRPGGESRDDLTDPSIVKRQTRTKFTCPNCKRLNVWAKADALVACHICSIEAGESVLLRANYPRRAGKSAAD